MGINEIVNVARIVWKVEDPWHKVYLQAIKGLTESCLAGVH